MIKCIKFFGLSGKKYIIKKSGLFDEIYYLKSYPDVRQADIDPIKHYILFGEKERRNPSPYFQTAFYLDKYPDVAQSGVNPLLHYILFGAKEGRWPNPEFDSGYYLLANPDVKDAGLNPLVHYIKYGQYEGRKTKVNNGERLLAIQNDPAKLIKLLRLINKTNVKKSIDYIRTYGLKAFFDKMRLKLNTVNSDLKIYEENYKNISDVIDLLLPEPFIPQVSISRPIDILIPVYNGREFLDSLLKSIVKNTFVPYRLLIANDKSTDPSISKYLADFENNNPNIDITIIENEENLGFVKTVNKLAKLTKNHFVIINTDTEVPPHWLERMIYPIIIKNNIASVTPFTNAGTICSFPNFLVDNPIFEGMDVATLDSYFQYVDFEKNYVEIPTAVGFCMAVNRKVYEKIGLFDEIFGRGFYEENDWSMRARKNGYKHVIATNLFVYHKHGGSFLSEEKKKLNERNSKIMREKHPEYFKLVEEFVRKDPLKDLRENLSKLIRESEYNKAGKPTVFYIGHLSAKSGVGEAARGYIKSLELLGFQIKKFDLSEKDWFNRLIKEYITYYPSYVFVHMTANEFLHFLEYSYYRRNFFARIKKISNVIGVWAWESNEPTNDFVNASPYFDEIFSISSYMKEALQKLNINTSVVPHVVELQSIKSEEIAVLKDIRKNYNFIVGYMCDLNSWSYRKNPIGVIEAFIKAFNNNENVALILKISGWDKHTTDMLEINNKIKNSKNIYIVKEYWTDGQKNFFYENIDVYLALFRAEGFGLTVAEAMLHGVPVVCTKYSGVLDFTDEKSVFYVNYQLSPIPQDWGPYKKGWLWANPDVEEASQLLAYIYKNTNIAKVKAKEGQEKIRKMLSKHNIASIIYATLSKYKYKLFKID
ncbi:glycosyltransferase [Thermoanaerobacterium sp. RBIITD]|uniref:glycosyltransferase n=1 Tax=Thermoanaerobacterium sp. RBIITD TaxID=1550240 RepID=UPI000BB6BAE0|nr:glycosyltransferase [Thermoanaerobacterium sp. RBIITD]SNX52859.1 Glycosyltransferase, GT2 family [Thermoanaerobacterium sp. RBIITD]